MVSDFQGRGRKSDHSTYMYITGQSYDSAIKSIITKTGLDSNTVMITD